MTFYTRAKGLSKKFVRNKKFVRPVSGGGRISAFLGMNPSAQLVNNAKAPTELWRCSDATCGFASPLIHRGGIYFLGQAGVLTCVEARSGRLLFEERVGDGGWASPIGAGDRAYVFGEKLSTTVLAAENAFRPLATNDLSFNKTVCGVAATDGALLFRAYEDLVCIGKPGSAAR